MQKKSKKSKSSINIYVSNLSLWAYIYIYKSNKKAIEKIIRVTNMKKIIIKKERKIWVKKVFILKYNIQPVNRFTR